MGKILKNGQSKRQVSKRFDISQIVVSGIRTRFRETDRYTRRSGKGIHRMEPPQIDRYISFYALRSRVASARPIQMDFRRGTGVQLFGQMTRNRLHEDNCGMLALSPILTQLHSGMLALSPILTQLHHRARMAFALDHVR